MHRAPVASLAPKQRRTRHTSSPPMPKLHRNAALAPPPAHTRLIHVQRWSGTDPKRVPIFQRKRTPQPPTARPAPKPRRANHTSNPPNAKTAPQCYVGAPTCPHTPDPRPELAYRSLPQNWFRSETYRRTGVLVPQRPGPVLARARKLRAGTFGCAGWGTRARWPALYAGGAPAPMPETTFDYCVGFQAAPVE